MGNRMLGDWVSELRILIRGGNGGGRTKCATTCP